MPAAGLIQYRKHTGRKISGRTERRVGKGRDEEIGSNDGIRIHVCRRAEPIAETYVQEERLVVALKGGWVKVETRRLAATME